MFVLSGWWLDICLIVSSGKHEMMAVTEQPG